MPRHLLRALSIASVLALLGLASAQEVVNVYSARHYDSDQTLFDLFTEQTGIQVNLIEAGADELIERIRSEGANSPADVIVTVDAGRLWRADEAGLLASIDSDALEAAIPANLRHPDGRWFGLSLRARGLVYSVDRVDPSELSTYEDLAGDAWRDRVCIRSSTNIYNISLTASVIASAGVDAAQAWANGLARNFARNPQGGDTDQIRAVAAGECDVAVVNHYYLARLIASSDAGDQAVARAVGWFFPNQDDRGTHVNVSGAGVVATAPNPANAIRFLEFLATPEAQTIFASANHEYPALEGVAVSEAAQGFGTFRSDAVNVAAYGEHSAEALRVMDRANWP
ncbi:MAG: Fe(3+) ABC transporter substrate-binding protein [Trueperaceae bacterium]|nr:Fe(3+) ABC transporter substrate-binding protein [Trueperaceae bacterium]